jgi:membrane protease YdiL (CAAX protease family)
MLVRHLLALLLIVIVPIWDRVETRRLKTSRDPRVKVQSYWITMGWLWVCSAIAVVTVGWPPLYTASAYRGTVAWIPSGPDAASFIIGLAIAALLALFVPVVLVRRSPRFRERVASAFAKLSFFLPATREERRWFVGVSISAGICEEILFRGFLITYFCVVPFHAPVLAGLLLSSLFFGTGHLYQGFTGVVQTAIMGFVFGGIFLISGSLLIPMILHAAVDLRILFLLPTAASTAGSATN